MGLALLAHSADDVPAISALVQDAAVRRSEIHVDPLARRCVLLMARYCWEALTPTRRRAALRFEHVTAVQQQGFSAVTSDTVLDLLSIDAAADRLTLTFAGGPALKLTVETLDITLEDFGDSWPAVRIPKH